MEIIPEDELRYRHDDIVRNRETIRSEFVESVNVVRPAHPFMDYPYPASMDDFEFSYCQESSPYWAKCGPRHHNVALFSADRKTMGRMDKERYYNVLVHELTHITEGSHTKGSAHNPQFWRTLANNAVRFIKYWDKPFDTAKFVSYCRHEPNAPMTDRRSKTVNEQQQAVEDRILRQL
jgi:hypothetical protein